jgi:prevent-host-death family protein
MARIVNLYEAKTHLSTLVEAAERGEEIIIAKNGVAKARLTPIGPLKRVRKPSGLLTISYIADDFDTPDVELDRLYEDECGAEA